MKGTALLVTPNKKRSSVEYFIANLKPQLILFIENKYNPEIHQIIKDLNLKDKNYVIEKIKENYDLDKLIMKFKEMISTLNDNYDLFIDYNHDENIINEAIIIAAYESNYNLEKNKNFLNHLKKLQENIIKTPDSYEFKRGMYFFNKYQFIAAKTNFNLALEKIEDETLINLTKFYISIVNLYDRWDKFYNHIKNKPIGSENEEYSYISLNSYLDNILDKIDELNISDYLMLNQPGFLTQLRRNHIFLNKKINFNGSITLKNVDYFIPDLFNNTRRRILEGKYDDAVARLYRIIELIGQIGLVYENLIDETIFTKFKEFKVSKKKVEQLNDYKTRSIIFNLDEYQKTKYSSFNITLKRTYELLDKLGVKFATSYLNNKNLRNKLNKRNISILAHGLEPISEEEALSLYNTVYTYASELYDELKINIEISKFPAFDIS